ncbi:MAG: hypothetical protein M1834_002086 [Cirrosporium novae-zelandiae]|nr:MAG: hypothetical protein M1834_002086 [Cirrosporium novae-zelandiae]
MTGNVVLLHQIRLLLPVQLPQRHAPGASCNTYNDCSNDYICTNGKCAVDTGAAAASTSAVSGAGTSNSSLSTGSKVAIGVCVPIAALALGAVAFLLIIRRRKARKASDHEPRSELPTGYNDDTKAKQEMQGRSAEIQSTEKVELDARQTHLLDSQNVSELSAGDILKYRTIGQDTPAELEAGPNSQGQSVVEEK